jgi:hypothetical protein
MIHVVICYWLGSLNEQVFDVESSVVGVLALDGPDFESSSSQPLLVVNIEVVEKLNLTVEVCRDVYGC